MDNAEGISPIMQARLAGADARFKHNLPFESLDVGKTFHVPIDSIKDTVLRSMATKAGKRLDRKFIVLKHPNVGIFEIGRKS